MISKRLAPLLACFGIGFSGWAAAEELPTRKPGLWESSMTSFDGRTQPMHFKQCVDATTDRNVLTGVAGGACDLKWHRVSEFRIETETACRMGQVMARGRGVVTGDFNSSLRIETTTTTTVSMEGMPPGMPRMNFPEQTQTMVIEARWIGPCEPGQKPGDMIMPDGRIMQMPGM
jgi:hypothetical protein